MDNDELEYVTDYIKYYVKDYVKDYIKDTLEIRVEKYELSDRKKTEKGVRVELKIEEEVISESTVITHIEYHDSFR